MSTDLTTIAAEEKAKLEGIKRAADNTPDFTEKVLVLIYEIPAGTRLTICKVRKACEQAGIFNTGHPNAWGAVMRSAVLRGLIRKKDGEMVPSSTPGCHRRPVQVWERV